MSRILITGAARGIGAESARRLAQRGHQLALLGLEKPELDRVAAETGATAYEVDVTDHEALDATIAEAIGALGGLDVVIANAGIASAGMVRTMDPAAWQQVIDVNLVGTYRTVLAALPSIIDSRGYVLPIASLAAIAHAPLMSAYAASKAGVEAFADSLRTEMTAHGVAVGCGYFSWIDTDMVRGSDEVTAFAKMRGSLKPPLSKTYPVSVAADAIVAGVEGRKKHVMGPGWIKYLHWARAAVEPIGRLQAKGDVPEVERLWEQELAAKGVAEVSAPVGAGGRALRRS